MKKISVMEFKEYCDKMSHKSFVYDTVNQSWDGAGNMMRIKIRFCDMKIIFNPNIICLASGENYMKFERVKQVIVNEKSLLGTIFTFVCGDSQGDSNNITYTVIAQ